MTGRTSTFNVGVNQYIECWSYRHTGSGLLLITDDSECQWVIAVDVDHLEHD